MAPSGPLTRPRSLSAGEAGVDGICLTATREWPAVTKSAAAGVKSWIVASPAGGWRQSVFSVVAAAGGVVLAHALVVASVPAWAALSAGILVWLLLTLVGWHLRGSRAGLFADYLAMAIGACCVLARLLVSASVPARLASGVALLALICLAAIAWRRSAAGGMTGRPRSHRTV